MTERGYFFNGISRGDAQEAPYSAQLFSSFIERAYQTEGGYVLPEWGNELITYAGAGKTVNIGTGGAVIKGVYIYSDAIETVTIADNTSPYPRIDTIYMFVNFGLQTVNIAVAQGVPNTIADIPSLVQNDNLWQMPIAHVYVPSGFAAMSDTYILDQREFANTPFHDMFYHSDNLMHNSEFMGFSALAPYPIAVLGNVPDMWEEVGTTALFNAEPRFDQMQRGRCIYITASTGNGMQTYINALQGPHTVKLLIQVEQDLARITIGGTSKLIPATAGPIEFKFRDTMTGATLMTIDGGSANTSIFKIGQITLATGWVGAPFVPRHEFILFDTLIQHGNYRGLTGTTTGTYEISADFDIPRDPWKYPVMIETRAILAKLGYFDTGSAGGGCSCGLQSPNGLTGNFLRVDVTRLPNSTYREVVGFVGYQEDRSVDQPLSFDMDIVATGAGTGFPTVQCLGVVV